MVATSARVHSDRFDCDPEWVLLLLLQTFGQLYLAPVLPPVRDLVQSEERNRHLQETNPFSLE